MRRFWLPGAVVLLLALIVVGALLVQQLVAARQDVDANPTYSVEQDVTYCAMGSETLLTDIYRPLGPNATMPLVMYVHGGGLTSGSKRAILAEPERTTLHALTTHGYVVASIDYRLAPRDQFPAMIEDAKCAVRFFRENAAAYGIDPHRIAAWGDSAGGFLVCLLGTTDHTAGWDTGPYLDQSSRVEAVIDWFGATDLTTLPQNDATTLPLQEAFSNTQHYTLVAASPISYVSAGDAPTLIVQGTDDSAVPPSQSQEYSAALQKAGITSRLQLVQHAEHEFRPHPIFAPISPSLDAIGQLVVQFLDQEVKNNPDPRPK